MFSLKTDFNTKSLNGWPNKTECPSVQMEWGQTLE